MRSAGIVVLLIAVVGLGVAHAASLPGVGSASLGSGSDPVEAPPITATVVNWVPQSGDAGLLDKVSVKFIKTTPGGSITLQLYVSLYSGATVLANQWVEGAVSTSGTTLDFDFSAFGVSLAAVDRVDVTACPRVTGHGDYECKVV